MATGAYKTDQELITYANTYINTNSVNAITGAIHNLYLLNAIESKVNADALTPFLKEYNSSWTFKGTAWVGKATPSSPSAGDAYLAVEAGTVFGKTVTKYQMLVFTTVWTVEDLDLTSIFYTQTAVDALFAAHSASGDHDGRYYTETEIDAMLASYAADGKVKVSAADSTADYLSAKINAGKSLTASTGNPTGSQYVNIDFNHTLEENLDAADYSIDNINYLYLNRFYHNDDLDTYFDFTEDQMNFYSGGVRNAYFASNIVRFNSGLDDMDFQIGSTLTNYMFFIDAANSRIGINTNNPAYDLSLDGTMSVSEGLYFSSYQNYYMEIFQRYYDSYKSATFHEDYIRYITFENALPVGTSYMKCSFRITVFPAESANAAPDGLITTQIYFQIKNDGTILENHAYVTNLSGGAGDHWRVGEVEVYTEGSPTEYFARIPIYANGMGSGRSCAVRLEVLGGGDAQSQFGDWNLDTETPYTWPGTTYMTVPNRLGVGLGSDTMPTVSLEVGGTTKTDRLIVDSALQFALSPTNGYVLTSDASGNASWQPVTASGGVSGTGSSGQIAYWDGTSSITGSSELTWSGGALTVGDVDSYLFFTKDEEFTVHNQGTNVFQVTFDVPTEESLQFVSNGTTQLYVNQDGFGLTNNGSVRVDTIETTLTNDDTHLPTSGAVVDYVSSNTYWKRTGTTLEPVTNGDDILLTSGEALYLYSTSNYITGTSSGITVASSDSITLASGTSTWTVNSNVLEVSASTFEIGEDAKDSALFAVHFDAADDTKPDNKNIVFYLYDLEAPLYSYIHGQGTAGSSLDIKYKANNEHNFYYNDHEVWTEIVNITSDGIYPGANNTYSLGNISYQWSYLYVDNTAYIDNLQLTSGATVNTIQTTITNSDTALPTSGAVYDAIAAVTDNNYYLDNVVVNSISDVDFMMTGTADITGIDFSHTHPISEITNLQTTLDSKVNIVGSPAPSDNQLAVWVDSDTLEGTSDLSWNGTVMFVNGAIRLTSGVQVDSIETTLTDDDTHLPTSGAVYDAISTATPAITDNYVVVGTGSSIEGTSGLTFDGDTLAVESVSTTASFTLGVTGSPADNVTLSFLEYTGLGNIASIAVGSSTIISQTIILGQIITNVANPSSGTGISINEGSNQLAFAVSGSNQMIFTSSGMQLAAGATVNQIETSITDSDTRLATSGAVVDYVTGLGYVDYSGTPHADEIAVWSDGDTITGDANFTWDGSALYVNGSIQLSIGPAVSNIQTTISDTDAALATSGAIVDYVAGLGYVGTTGTPANNQIAVFTDSDTIEGDSNFTWDGSNFVARGTLQLLSGTTVDTIETTLTDDDDHIPTSGAVYYEVDFLQDQITSILTAPSAPTGLSLTESGSYVEVEFSGTDVADAYEVWASQTSATSNYDLVAVVNGYELDTASPGGSPQTILVFDNTYEYKSTIYYRIFAKRQGLYSLPLEGNITPVNDVADADHLAVTEFENFFFLKWNNPIDRRFDYVEVKVDAQAVEGNLAEGNATTCYEGQGDNFVYEIATGEESYYHQFWVYTYTKS